LLNFLKKPVSSPAFATLLVPGIYELLVVLALKFVITRCVRLNLGNEVAFCLCFACLSAEGEAAILKVAFAAHIASDLMMP
jgi:hypothetical protein